MTPKQKAQELYFKMYKIDAYNDYHLLAKQCSLIAVDLHLEELSKMKLIFSDRELHYKYWQEVRTEIEKL